MRQIHTETWESIAFIQKTNPIIFVMFISLFFDYCIKKGIEDNLFGV